MTISGTGQQQLNIGSTNAGGAAIILDGDSNGDASGGDYSLIRHNTDGDLEFYARSTGGATNTIFKQGTSEKLRIASDGNIGINENNPQSMLHISGNGGVLAVDSYPTLTLQTGSADATADKGTGIIFLNYDGSGGAFGGSIQCLKENISNNNQANYMRFATRANNAAVTERLRITSDGNIGFNRTTVNAGNTITQNSTSTPTRFVFNGDYSSGYTDASLKIYLFNDGATRHGFTSGPSHDLQYHASGASYSKHTFFTQNNKDMNIEAGQVTKPRTYQFIVETNGTTVSGGWSKLSGLTIDASNSTGVSNGTYWSNTNQRFTAAVTGTYNFFFGGWGSYSTSTGDRYAVCFRVNNGSFTYISGGAYSAVDSPLNGYSINQKLSANDYVELWYYSAGSNTWGGGHRVFWGGILLG